MTEIEKLELRITKALDRLHRGISANKANTEHASLDISLELVAARNAATLAQNKLNMLQKSQAREEKILREQNNSLTEEIMAFEAERVNFDKIRAELTVQIADGEKIIAQLRADLSEQVKRRDEDLAALDALIAELEEVEVLQGGQVKSYAG